MKRRKFYQVAETARCHVDGEVIPERYVTGRCTLAEAKEVQRALGDRYAIFEITIYDNDEGGEA